MVLFVLMSIVLILKDERTEETTPCYPNMQSELEDLLVKYESSLIVEDGNGHPALRSDNGTGIKYINGFYYEKAKQNKEKRDINQRCYG